MPLSTAFGVPGRRNGRMRIHNATSALCGFLRRRGWERGPRERLGPGDRGPTLLPGARPAACQGPRCRARRGRDGPRHANPSQPNPDPDGPFSQPQAVRATTFPLAKLIGITPEGSWKEGGLPVTRGQGDARPRSRAVRGAAAASAPNCARALATSSRFDFAL